MHNQFLSSAANHGGYTWRDSREKRESTQEVQYFRLGCLRRQSQPEPHPRYSASCHRLHIQQSLIKFFYLGKRQAIYSDKSEQSQNNTEEQFHYIFKFLYELPICNCFRYTKNRIDVLQVKCALLLGTSSMPLLPCGLEC